MVLWCRTCGALMGLREPLVDWAVDRNSICAACAEKEAILSKDELKALADSNEGPLPIPASD